MRWRISRGVGEQPASDGDFPVAYHPSTPLAAARQHIEARHAHRDAHFHLLGNRGALRVVRHPAGDLHAAVHRAGVHHQRIGLRQRQPLVESRP
jgi:hypothetical protein